MTSVLNPKAIVFYMAFLAQFIDPQGDLPVQLAVLTVTSSLVVVGAVGRVCADRGARGSAL